MKVGGLVASLLELGDRCGVYGHGVWSCVDEASAVFAGEAR